MILRLPADSLLTSVLERFALRVCESNVHWALQLTWIAYGALEENRPELDGSDAEVHARAARLLQLIEQTVVYGSRLVNRDTLRAAAFSHNMNAWLRSLTAAVSKGAAENAEGAQADERRAALEERRAALEAGAAAASAARRAAWSGVRPPLPEHKVAGAIAAEGYLLKRKARDSWGVWRCCGESWTRRWFTLRDCVLYYHRQRGDARARGTLPLAQCRIEMRESPRVGEYIKLSARFSRRTLRLRGATPEQTNRWYSLLRSEAGLPPLAPPQALTLAERARPRGNDAKAGAAPADAESAGAKLPPLEIPDGAGRAKLSMSQRCSWMYLSAQRDFVRDLAALSEELYTPGAPGALQALRPRTAAARSRLRALLDAMRIPPLAYVPLCTSSAAFKRVVRTRTTTTTATKTVAAAAGTPPQTTTAGASSSAPTHQQQVRIPADDVNVFVTRERASVLLYAEVVPDPKHRKLARIFQSARNHPIPSFARDGPTIGASSVRNHPPLRTGAHRR